MSKRNWFKDRVTSIFTPEDEAYLKEIESDPIKLGKWLDDFWSHDRVTQALSSAESTGKKTATKPNLDKESQ